VWLRSSTHLLCCPGQLHEACRRKEILNALHSYPCPPCAARSSRVPCGCSCVSLLFWSLAIGFTHSCLRCVLRWLVLSVGADGMECCMDLALSELHDFTLISQVSALHAFCFGLVQWLSLTLIATTCSLIHVHLDSLAVVHVLVFCNKQLLLTIHFFCLAVAPRSSGHVPAEVHSRGANPNGLACSCRRAILRWLRQRYDAVSTPFVNSDVIVNIALCCAHSLHTVAKVAHVINKSDACGSSSVSR
jgi:hypothetical protein